MYRFWYNSNFYGNFNYVNANIKFMISHLYIVRLSLFKIMRDSHSQPHNTLPTQLTGSSNTTLYKLLVLYSQCGTRVFTYTKTCNSKAMHFFYKIYMDNCVIYSTTYSIFLLILLNVWYKFNLFKRLFLLSQQVVTPA
jgi:hypothetical protein